MNWDAIREEYLAGGVGLARLAGRHGLKPGAVKRRSKDEGWVALRRERAARKGDADGAGKATDGPGGDDAQIALRIRRHLLMKLERAADTIPYDATELKTTEEDGAVKLLKLRDLTAAYKELVGDLPAEDGAGERRVVIDL